MSLLPFAVARSSTMPSCAMLRRPGLENLIKLVSNGSDAPGTILDDCSLEFQSCYRKADLVIAKGQGNYETLSNGEKNIFFLFKIKCQTVASHTGFKQGTNVLTRASR